MEKEEEGAEVKAALFEITGKSSSSEFTNNQPTSTNTIVNNGTLSTSNGSSSDDVNGEDDLEVIDMTFVASDKKGEVHSLKRKFDSISDSNKDGDDHHDVLHDVNVGRDEDRKKFKAESVHPSSTFLAVSDSDHRSLVDAEDEEDEEDVIII